MENNMMDKLRELCRLLHDGRIAIKMQDNGNELAIQWTDAFVSKKRKETARIQELVYRDEELTTAIATLTDGLYGAVRLWETLTTEDTDAD